MYINPKVLSFSHSLLFQNQCSKQGKDPSLTNRPKTLSAFSKTLNSPFNIFHQEETLISRQVFINPRISQSPSSSFPETFLVLGILGFVVCFRIVLKKMSLPIKKDEYLIREVWNDNLEEELNLIQSILDEYHYIAMDTEFPGVVIHHVPFPTFENSNEYNYQKLRVNVDLLKLIQLGLTFSDKNGKLPTCGTGQKCVWQFNFCDFNVNEDMQNLDSINLLVQSGMDFAKMSEKGIPARRFSELLMGSGIVLNDAVVWVTFHSGYDFGYLLKMLTCMKLPDKQGDFFKLINVFFPKIYDLKHLMRFCNNLHGGLNKLAAQLNVQRFGTSHQAGSDSLLTSDTFVKLKNIHFGGSPERHAGVLYGLGVDG